MDRSEMETMLTAPPASLAFAMAQAWSGVCDGHNRFTALCPAPKSGKYSLRKTELVLYHLHWRILACVVATSRAAMGFEWKMDFRAQPETRV
jgi:hypothetical protein